MEKARKSKEDRLLEDTLSCEHKMDCLYDWKRLKWFKCRLCGQEEIVIPDEYKELLRSKVERIKQKRQRKWERRYGITRDNNSRRV